MGGEPGKVSLVTGRHIDYINTKGCLVGCDSAGLVAETGTGYETPWKVGDRVAALAHGGNSLQQEDGAFAERIAVKADLQMHAPPHLSFEEAATLGAGVVTCGQGLAFIYGGSSATGSLGIQFAKLAGYRVITTCSLRNFDLVKSVGAEAVFDYNDPEFTAKTNDYTKGNLNYVWDTIALLDSAKICSEVISPGGRYGSILRVEFPRKDDTTTMSMGYTATSRESA
ncbi:hypothetical protein PV04_07206 [Phialophora macrospora]|uniref:Uncharacterized protein n=1 Tax=Phialophora macrospora TaxID=1851006 RepID=A0A0D2DRU0_9EURO|nr:hypothetical protein PV04_07206 [Phialophora macrospora]